ncbi:RecF/RecN/SMC N terminal domain-containing protein [Marinitoga hydrogenitolerans DSM 16785]|uniref:RecF/RecN/SMC N terminal domain-containing protein n=1 Tax=Marinitoga hydrogenitolerans (strain DSM 16785 / JCM 12826 / AT1271) TaxID=1122195 RepID=A0A1M5AH75_MARH1|nr:hypothetical protein [Marinitoga hydrogenitolerans]SHF29484.1 RecF/RecN/SMC N terminal domain-containing protein [Marinitoga hydrogenitolerans DSM 16785]
MENELNNLRKIFEKRNAILKEKEKLEDEIKIYLRKLELTKEFRDKIKTMGIYVSKEFTKTVSIKATENYIKMSEKNEKIIWDSEDNYQVKIHDDIKGERNFSILSGGEQVSVAISISMALANFLSKANIYLLDKPTINLDEERRNMLAENLKNMLNEIEQAFIVTHDGTFTEMAQKVINFESPSKF